MPDPLAIVLRIRRVTVDDARRQLAASLRIEERSIIEAEAADAAISEEGQVAADLMGDDNTVEAYAAWLPVGRARAAVAWAACERARSAVSVARAALTVARAAAEAADTLLGDRQRAAALAGSRKAQAEMDEIAGRIRARVDR